ncbi:MAG: hypothetical protein ACJ8CR_29650 [Roseiflexaceae bacterium]
MEDVTFTRGPARRPLARVADPLLQWATGLQTKERRIYAGWLAEAGRLEALDAAMEQAGFKQITIKHGSGNLVTHWAVETANLFVIAEGVQSIGEMSQGRSTGSPQIERYGIAFGWRTLPGGRQQSQLRFRAFLQELLAVGFVEPLLVTVKGTLTGDLITALTRQYDVLDAVEAFRKQAGKPPSNPPFYACSIPLGPGAEVTRGSGGATKEITPIVANIPTPITKEYILAHWIKRPWVPLIEDLLDATIAWSITTSAMIGLDEEQAAGAPIEEEPPPPPQPAPPGNGRRQMVEDLL